MKRTKKWTKAQERAIDVEREARLQAFEAFSDKYTGLVFKAEVLWFSGTEGSVRGLNGEGTWTLYACNIPGAKTWYPETACVSHQGGQIIDVEIKVSYGGSIAVSRTPGTVDQARWDALDKTRLAFRCDDDGKPVTGLFAKGAGL